MQNVTGQGNRVTNHVTQAHADAKAHVTKAHADTQSHVTDHVTKDGDETRRQARADFRAASKERLDAAKIAKEAHRAIAEKQEALHDAAMSAWEAQLSSPLSSPLHSES